MTRWEYCLSSASTIYRPFHWDIHIPSASYFECTVHCFLPKWPQAVRRFPCCAAAALYLCAVLPLSHTPSHTSFPASGDHPALLHCHEVSFWVGLSEAPWPPLGWSHHLCFGLSLWSDVSKMSQMKLWLWISAPDGTPSCLSDNCMWNLKTCSGPRQNSPDLPSCLVWDYEYMHFLCNSKFPNLFTPQPWDLPSLRYPPYLTSHS